MAFPRCPACKAAAIARGEDPKALCLPRLSVVDRDAELAPGEDAVYRTYECSCGYVTLTREAEVEPGISYPTRHLRQGKHALRENGAAAARGGGK